MARSTLLLTIISFSQFASVAFLIICCVTAPVFKQIGLSKYNDITYGVFGYCKNDNGCFKASASYNVSNLSHNNDNWKMSGSVRSKLEKILIVTPVAAGLNFFAFLTSIISIIIISFNNDGVLSVTLFVINLFFDIVGFFSAALMCIVVFLLFFPNMTWCSWLLIPAAVLPLINLPIICTGYLSNDNNINYDDTSDHLSDTENEFTLSINEDHADNAFSRSNEKIILRDAILPSETESRLEKKSDTEVFTQPLQNTSTLSYNNLNSFNDNEYVPTYDIHHDSSNTDIDGNSTSLVDGDDQLVDANNRQSFTAFSVIDNDKGANQSPNSGNNNSNLAYNNLESIASSNYSTIKDLNHIDQPSNKILEDIMNDQNNQDAVNKVKHASDEISTGSDFTSISQRGVNPNYVENQNRIMDSSNNNINHSNTLNKPNILPYPHSRTTSQLQHNVPMSNNHMNPQVNNNFLSPNGQANFSRNNKQNALPAQYHQNNMGMQQRSYNSNTNSKNIVNQNGIKNNGSFQPSQIPMQQMRPKAYNGNNNSNINYQNVQVSQNSFQNTPNPQHQQYITPMNNNQRYNSNFNPAFSNNVATNVGITQQSPVHFQSAYKKRMAARNNIYNNMQNQNNGFNLR